MDTKTLKKVYDKINKKTALSAEKIELSAIDELIDAKNNLELITYDTGSGFDSLENWDMLDSMVSEFRDAFQRIKELAVELTELYETMDSLSAEAPSSIQELENALSTYEDLAGELGFDVNSNNDYVEAEGLRNLAYDYLSELDNILVATGDDYRNAQDIAY
jgi:ABC-type transporter Mla subunit MlaD